jgi:hypothetical protein
VCVEHDPDIQDQASVEPTCVRCGCRSGMPGLDLCTPCAVTVRVELSGGLVRLERYLSRWAAFDVWLGERGLGRAVASS